MPITIEQFTDYASFLYSRTPLKGKYSSKVTIEDANDEVITLNNSRSKIVEDTDTPSTNSIPLVDALYQKLEELMPSDAISLDANVVFTLGDVSDTFNIKFTKSHSNTAQQLGSIFENGRRYSARLANK